MLTRRDLSIAVIAIVSTAAFMTFAQSAAKPIMRSKAFEWSSLKATPTRVGERRGIFDTATTTLERFESHVTTLNPGEAPHAAHKHPEEELMIVKEGTIEAILNGETNRVEAGSYIFCASGEMHGLRNVGTNRATYYVLKWFPYDLATHAK